MRDGLWITGNIAAATKDTIAYSADTLDLGTLGTYPNKKTVPEDLYACFQQTGSPDADDSFIFHVQTADDSSFSTNAELYSFPQTETNVPQGKIFRYKMPTDLRRYVRLACTPKSTATFSEVTVGSWVELGVRKW